MYDPTGLPESCKQYLREIFGILNMETMRALTPCMGYPTLIKHMIEKGERPTDEQLIQMMDAILESCRVYRAFLDEVKSDLYS